MTAVSNRTQKKADAGLAKARKLAAETVVFEITISKPSLRSRVRSRDVVTDREVDANQFHVRKDLIDRSALKALLKHESQFKNGWLMRRAIPCGMLRGGMYLLPL